MRLTWTNLMANIWRKIKKYIYCSSLQSHQQGVIYLICDFCSKQPASSSRADGPRVHIFRIRPHQVAKRSFVRDFLVPLNGSNLVQGLNVWGEASVDTQDLFIQQLKNKQTKHFWQHTFLPVLELSNMGPTTPHYSVFDMQSGANNSWKTYRCKTKSAWPKATRKPNLVCKHWQRN